MKSLSTFFPVGLLALLLLVVRLPTAAQAPVWQSARAIAAVAVVTPASFASSVTATAVDAAGNVYLAGNFSNMVALGNTTLTSVGSNDVFVAKFNPAINQFVWAQRAGGTGADYAIALAVSGTSVYVAGSFSSAATFGSITLADSGNEDTFVAKLTDAGSTGSFVWAQRAGGTSLDTATALAVSGTDVYIAGYFYSTTATFGATALTNANASAGVNTSDVFVAKLTDAGSTGGFVWAQRAGGTSSDQATALAVNGTSVYVAGGFRSLTAGFGAFTLANAGFTDVFVTKLTDTGSTSSFVWVQQAGGVNDDQVNALAVSGSSVYMAGKFASAAVSFGTTSLTNAAWGVSDVFVAKLTDMGITSSFAWAQRAGGTNEDQGIALAMSGSDVYVAGKFASTAMSFGIATLTPAGDYDVFVAKLTDAGNTGSFVWAQRAGGTGEDQSVAVSTSGTIVYVAGYFNGPAASFGTITLTNPNPLATPNLYSTLGFLSTLTDPTLTATAPSHALIPAQLYPNPAHHTATLRLPPGTAPAPLTLTDALGRAVRRYPAPAEPEAVLDLRSLPAGLYLLRGAGPVLRLQVE